MFDILGPEDITRHENGLYQWSVTLKAQMWPPVEASTPKTLLGLSSNAWWTILVVCIIIALLCICAIIFYRWLLPRHRIFFLPHTRSKIQLNSSVLSTHDSNTFSE